MLPMNPLNAARPPHGDYVGEWVMVAINSQFYNIDFLFMKSILQPNVHRRFDRNWHKGSVIKLARAGFSFCKRGFLANRRQ